MTTSNGKSEISLDSLSPSGDGGDILLEAWRIALAETLDAQEERWEKHCALMEAKSLAIISSLEAKVATRINELDQQFTTRILERLAGMKDGEQGPPGPRGEHGSTGEP